MGLLSGKVALITGAGKGIGQAVALRFAAEGADIAFTDLRIEEGPEGTEARARQAGVRCKGYISDASDFAATQQVVEEILTDFGRIDILVNNAGITRDGLILRMSEEQWDEVIRVNLKSAFNFTRAVTPVMVRQRGGSIINMSSVVGLGGNAGQANYAASKAGMVALAKSVAKELGPKGIRANCIAPGFIHSDMTARLSPEIIQEWEKRIPLRRGGTMDEVAGVALFLASELSAYVSGQVVVCDGAMNG